MKGKSEMLRKISHNIAYFFVREKIIDIEYIEIYQYGFEQIISTLISIITVILIGLLTGDILLPFIFLAFFIPLRFFAGGYHEDSYLRFYIGFVLIFLVELYIIYKNILSNNASISVALTIISIIIISFLSPVEDKNKPLTDSAKKRHKITAINIMLIEFGVAFLLRWQSEKIFYTVITSIIVVALLQMIAILRSFNNLVEKGGN
jgi:accessory gene regulator B